MATSTPGPSGFTSPATGTSGFTSCAAWVSRIVSVETTSGDWVSLGEVGPPSFESGPALSSGAATSAGGKASPGPPSLVHGPAADSVMVATWLVSPGETETVLVPCAMVQPELSLTTTETVACPEVPLGR